MLNFITQINKNLRKYKLIKTEKKLVACVSGGQDSISCIVLLYLLQTQMEFIFELLSFNHFWQKSSFFTMLHVSKCSYTFYLPALLILPLKQVRSEQSARDWRTHSTQRMQLFFQYDLCVQGHSKSDRIETILFNCIRGAGSHGLSALNRKLNYKMDLLRNKFYPTFYNFLKQTHFYLASKPSLNPVDCLKQVAFMKTVKSLASRQEILRSLSKSTTLKKGCTHRVNQFQFFCIDPKVLQNKTFGSNICYHQQKNYWQLKALTITQIPKYQKPMHSPLRCEHSEACPAGLCLHSLGP